MHAPVYTMSLTRETDCTLAGCPSSMPRLPTVVLAVRRPIARSYSVVFLMSSDVG